MALKTKPLRTYYIVPYVDWGGALPQGKRPPKLMFRYGSYEGSKTSNGVGVPDFKNKIKQGLDASSPYSVSIMTRDIVQGFDYGVYSYANTSGENYVAQALNVLPINISQIPIIAKSAITAREVSELCSASFAGKVRDRITSVSAPTLLGELRETISLIRNPLKGVVRLYQRYLSQVARKKRRISKRLKGRAFDRKSARELAKYARERYLEFTFGVTPLYYDIEGGIEALINLDAMIETKVTAKSNRKPDHGTYKHVSYSDGHRIERSEALYSHKIVGNIRSEVLKPQGSGDRLKSLLGFTPEEFIPTMWELVPGSFLLDYVTNVSDLIIHDQYTSYHVLAWANSSSRVIRKRTMDYVSFKNMQPTFSSPGSIRGLNGQTARLPSSVTEQLIDIERKIGVTKLTMSLDIPKPKQFLNLALITSLISEIKRR